MLESLKAIFGKENDEHRIRSYETKYPGQYRFEEGRHYWEGIELPGIPLVKSVGGGLLNPPTGYMTQNVLVNDPQEPEDVIFQIFHFMDYTPVYMWRGQKLPGHPDIRYGEEGEITVTIHDAQHFSTTPRLEIIEKPEKDTVYRVRGKTLPAGELLIDTASNGDVTFEVYQPHNGRVYGRQEDANGNLIGDEITPEESHMDSPPWMRHQL